MRRLAEASGIATPTRAELARFDRSRKNFGANGQRVLDGLVGSLDREVILASLSGHVRLKVDQLGDALRLELRETDRMLLADLLDEHDTLTRRVSEFDRYIDQALVSYAEACRLLETIPGIDRTRVLRPTGRPASAYPRNTGGIHMMNDEMCVVHARAAGLDVHVVTVTCWNWFAFAGDVAAQDGAIGRFVSIGTARAERADPAGSVPTRSPRAEFDPHIRPLRRELDLGRPVAPPEIGCALRERTRGLQLQKRLWEIPTVAARTIIRACRRSPSTTDAHWRLEVQRHASTPDAPSRTPTTGAAAEKESDGTTRGEEMEVPPAASAPGSPSTAAVAARPVPGGRIRLRPPLR